MKLSRTVAYAVQAAVQLASSDSKSPVPCSRLAADGRMPERFLLQILRSLVTHGILRSTRGVDGGYTLTRAPADISLLEVIEAIDGPLLAGSDLDVQLPAASQESLRSALEQVTATARSQLQSIKLSQLIFPPKPGAAAARTNLAS
jgi:Rrf2 family protein